MCEATNSTSSHSDKAKLAILSSVFFAKPKKMLISNFNSAWINYSTAMQCLNVYTETCSQTLVKGEKDNLA